jgi:hypothetical protein
MSGLTSSRLGVIAATAAIAALEVTPNKLAHSAAAAATTRTLNMIAEKYCGKRYAKPSNPEGSNGVTSVAANQVTGYVATVTINSDKT